MNYVYNIKIQFPHEVKDQHAIAKRISPIIKFG